MGQVGAVTTGHGLDSDAGERPLNGDGVPGDLSIDLAPQPQRRYRRRTGRLPSRHSLEPSSESLPLREQREQPLLQRYRDPLLG